MSIVKNKVHVVNPFKSCVVMSFGLTQENLILKMVEVFFFSEKFREKKFFYTRSDGTETYYQKSTKAVKVLY